MREQHRRDQAAAQVVEDLPAPDERQRIALEAVARGYQRKQPEQNLPVAADPAMLAPGVREDARRVFVDDLEVGDERHPGVQPFEQVVRQQRVLRNAVLERRRERVHVVQALAGEDALAEQILIRVGHRRGVRIHARVPRVQPREQRARRARERDAHPRLQNAVAFGDPARPRVE